MAGGWRIKDNRWWDTPKKNHWWTSKKKIVDQMTERRPLPLGVTEFHEWANRIIAGALISADVESQKFALANMLIELEPSLSHEADAYFIHRLRKTAVNQVADQVRTDIRTAVKARLEAEEQAKKLKLVCETDSVPSPNMNHAPQTLAEPTL